jgi:ribulose-5-phosphate 4-epimerase/fuculose-1-phosphate aldolase
MTFGDRMEEKKMLDLEGKKIGEELVRFARKAFYRKLVRGTGGNFSARFDAASMLMTASGLSLAETRLENLIRVEIKTLAWTPSGKLRPSREFSIHADIFRFRPETGAVLHVHSPYATAYAIQGRSIPLVTDSAFLQPDMPLVPFAPSGTEELRNNIARAIGEYPQCNTLLLEKHGVLALGTDIPSAFHQADLIEELAKIAHLAGRL